jgi:hypothetical protein
VRALLACTRIRGWLVLLARSDTAKNAEIPCRGTRLPLCADRFIAANQARSTDRPTTSDSRGLDANNRVKVPTIESKLIASRVPPRPTEFSSIAQTFDYDSGVSPEPLEHLAAVVHHEIACIQLEYLWYGMDLDLTATIDGAAEAVVITGESLRLSRPRRLLESRISRAALRLETHVRELRITVFPASSQDGAPA